MPVRECALRERCRCHLLYGGFARNTLTYFKAEGVVRHDHSGIACVGSSRRAFTRAPPQTPLQHACWPQVFLLGYTSPLDPSKKINTLAEAYAAAYACKSFADTTANDTTTSGQKSAATFPRFSSTALKAALKRFKDNMQRGETLITQNVMAAVDCEGNSLREQFWKGAES